MPLNEFKLTQLISREVTQNIRNSDFYTLSQVCFSQKTPLALQVSIGQELERMLDNEKQITKQKLRDSILKIQKNQDEEQERSDTCSRRKGRETRYLFFE